MKKTMKKIYKTLISLSCMILFSICFAAIPDQYLANYTVHDERENIKRIFIEIEANNGIWLQTPSSTFSSLNYAFILSRNNQVYICIYSQQNHILL